jgi:hypothetical protein
VSRFFTPAAALAYFVLAGMGVVTLLVAAGRVQETVVRKFVLPPVLLTLAVTGLWEWRRRKRAADAGGDQ